MEAVSVSQWCKDGVPFAPLSTRGGPKAADGRGGCAVRWVHKHCIHCGMPHAPDVTMCELCLREEARLNTPARNIRAVDALRNHHGGPLYRESSNMDFGGGPSGRSHGKRLKDYDEPVKPPSRFAGKDRHRPLEGASPDG